MAEKAPEPKPTEAIEEQLTLSKAELQKLIDENREESAKAVREQLAADRAKEKEEAERAKAEEQGEFKTLADTEKAKREESERKAAESERRAQLAEVNVQLRDHLAAKHSDYATNAPDIMLHVKDKLAPDAKPADVAKLIEAEAKAFVERTPRKASATPPPAPGRSGINSGQGGVRPLQPGAARRPFSTLRANV